MEFYSERCQDWLNKSQRIHPDKLVMEIERFKKMHEECRLDDIEAKEDLALTVQLLEERLDADQLDLVEKSEDASQDHAVTPESFKLSDTPNQQGPNWDLDSLTDPLGIETEILDTETKKARKQALLDHPSIALGVAGIKNNNR